MKKKLGLFAGIGLFLLLATVTWKRMTKQKRTISQNMIEYNISYLLLKVLSCDFYLGTGEGREGKAINDKCQMIKFK
jgi:hypothetical protein